MSNINQVPAVANSFQARFEAGEDFSHNITPEQVSVGEAIIYPVAKSADKNVSRGVRTVLAVSETTVEIFAAEYAKTESLKRGRLQTTLANIAKQVVSPSDDFAVAVSTIAKLELERERFMKQISSTKCIFFETWTDEDRAALVTASEVEGISQSDAEWAYFRKHYVKAERKASDGVKRTASEASKASSDKKKNALLAFANLNVIPTDAPVAQTTETAETEEEQA